MVEEKQEKKSKARIWMSIGIIGLICLCIGGFFLFIQRKDKEPVKTKTIVKTEDLSNHLIYKHHDFYSAENVIDFGEQPIWIPTSTISEVMKRDNILKEELNKLGFSIKFYPFLKGNDVNYFMFSNDLEVGIGGDMPAIRAVADGGITVVSIVQEGPVSIISRDIKEVKDLKGKKIAYALGSNAHFYLLNTLNKNGIGLRDVDLVKLDIVHMADALHERKIDAFSVWEPTASMALKKYPEFIVTRSGKSYGFIYVRDELLNLNPEAVHHILASEIRALRWLRESDENLKLASEWVVESASVLAARALKELPTITVQMISDLTKKDLPGILTKEYPRITADLLTEQGGLKKEFKLLQTLGLISEKRTWKEIKKCFDLKIIEEVISNPGKYRLFEKIQILIE